MNHHKDRRLLLVLPVLYLALMAFFILVGLHNIARVLNMVVATALIVQALRVIFTYLSVWSIYRKHNPQAMQLPLHVWCIAASHVVYVCVSIVESWVRIDDPLTFRVFVYPFALALSHYALANVLSFERRKYSEATGFGVISGEV